MNFNEKDLKQIRDRKSELSTIEAQLENFRTGFPFIKAVRPATISDGILRLDEEKIGKNIRPYSIKKPKTY